MGKYSALFKEIANLEKFFGVKFATADEAIRALAKQKAIAAGLPDVVFHGSPHAFADFRVGDDFFRHVAPDPRVAAQRVKDLRTPKEKMQFNLTPEEAKKLGFSKEDIKNGIIHELRTNLGNPLTVKDAGHFGLDTLIDDPAIVSALDPEDYKILKQKADEISKKWLIHHRAETPSFSALKDPNLEKNAKALEQEYKAAEKEGVDLLGQALKKRGYDSLRYKNTAEVPEEFKDLHDAYTGLSAQKAKISKALADETDPKQIKYLQKLETEVQRSLQKIENQFPDSYALFPDTPVRNIVAEMDPSKLKSEPGALLKTILAATGAGTAASTMMPQEAEAGVTYKLNEVAKILDGLKKAGKLTSGEFLKAINYAAPTTADDIAKIRTASRNALEHGLRDRAGVLMSSPNWRVNDEIAKTFYPELEDLFRFYEGRQAEKLMKDRGIKNAAGVFYSEPTGNPHIPYKGKDISVLTDSPALKHHEDTHALEYLMHPSDMHERTLAQNFGGKQSKDVFKQSNDELAQKLSILSKKGETKEEILDILNDIRPEGIGENKELRKFVNSEADRFKLGDAGHFIYYPQDFELTRALELLKDEVKVPKGSLKENKALIDQILNNPEMGENKVKEILDKIKENAILVPSAKKGRLTLPDKMPFAIAAATGAGLLANNEEASASERQDPDAPLNIKENKEADLSPEEAEKYLKLLKSSTPKTKKPDFTETMGESAGRAMNFLTDKFAPIMAKDEEGEDYTPEIASSPMAPLKALDNVTGRPLRRYIYELLGGEQDKNEVSGSDIIGKLEEKYGEMPEMPGATLKMKSALGLGLDVGLDPTILIPAVGEAKLGSKIGAKVGMESPTIGKLISKAVSSPEEFIRLQEAAKAAKAATEATEAAKEAERVKNTQNYLNSREQIRRILD